MRDRLKWGLAGLGLMVGIQLGIAWAIRLWFSTSVSNPESTFFVAVGYTIAAFMLGGLAMGVISDRRLFFEPIAAATGALVLNWACSAVNLSGEVLFFGDAVRHALEGKQRGANLAYAAGVLVVAIVAAIWGAQIGDRIETPIEDRLSTTALILGFAGLVAGPYVMLIGRVPLSILSIAAAGLLAGLGWGIYRFERRREEEISIRPSARFVLRQVH